MERRAARSVDSSLLALPAGGGLSALFGGFGEEDAEEAARRALPPSLRPLGRCLLARVAAALPRGARASLEAAAAGARGALRAEGTWRALCLGDLAPGAALAYRGSWRRTALALLQGGRRPRPARGPRPGRRARQRRLARWPPPRRRAPRAAGRWLARVARRVGRGGGGSGRGAEWTRHWADVSPSSFRRHFDAGGRPLLGRGAIAGTSAGAGHFRVRGWPGSWRRGPLRRRIEEATGGHARRPLGVVTPLGKTVTMTLRSYCTYLRRHRDADDPLYLFDSGELAAALFHSCLASTPSHVEDLLSAAEEPSGRAPAGLLDGLERRYLTVGPAGSGARFHVDPFAASAVSLLLRGRKLWAFFPPGAAPPGVRETSCGGRPVHESPPAAWWWRHVFPARGGRPLAGGAFFVQRAGDVVFTPSGWWHATLNVGRGPTAALTWHVCPPAGAAQVAAELRREGWGDAASWLAQQLRARHS